MKRPSFATRRLDLRRLNDMAFSGDGEPTTYRNFDTIIETCANLKRELDLDDVKMVLITNASMFHRPHVQRGLEMLDANNGEIWAKLDAGTEEYYKLIERTPIPFSRILENITSAARVRPIVIQSLFMRVAGEAPSTDELLAYCDRLQEIVVGRRAAQLGTGLYGGPPSGRRFCLAAQRCGSRCNRSNGARTHRRAGCTLLWQHSRTSSCFPAVPEQLCWLSIRSPGTNGRARPSEIQR